MGEYDLSPIQMNIKATRLEQQNHSRDAPPKTHENTYQQSISFFYPKNKTAAKNRAKDQPLTTNSTTPQALIINHSQLTIILCFSQIQALSLIVYLPGLPNPTDWWLYQNRSLARYRLLVHFSGKYSPGQYRPSYKRLPFLLLFH